MPVVRRDAGESIILRFKQGGLVHVGTGPWHTSYTRCGLAIPMGACLKSITNNAPTCLWCAR